MTAKIKFCKNILRQYNILVDFDGTPPDTVAKPIENETFASWKKRIFEDSDMHVRVYQPLEPNGNTRLLTLQVKSNAGHVKEIIKEVRKDIKAKNNAELHERIKEAKDEARKEIKIKNTTEYRQRIKEVKKEVQHAIKTQSDATLNNKIAEFKKDYATYSSESIEEIVYELEGRIAPPVVDKLRKIARDTPQPTDVKELIKELVVLYNTAIERLREQSTALKKE